MELKYSNKILNFVISNIPKKLKKKTRELC